MIPGVSAATRKLYNYQDMPSAYVNSSYHKGHGRPLAGTKSMLNHEEHEGHEEGCRHIHVWPKAKSLHVSHALHGELFVIH